MWVFVANQQHFLCFLTYFVARINFCGILFMILHVVGKGVEEYNCSKNRLGVTVAFL